MRNLQDHAKPPAPPAHSHPAGEIAAVAVEAVAAVRPPMSYKLG